LIGDQKEKCEAADEKRPQLRYIVVGVTPGLEGVSVF